MSYKLYRIEMNGAKTFLYESEDFTEVLACILNAGSNRFSMYIMDNGDIQFTPQSSDGKNYIVKKG